MRIEWTLLPALIPEAERKHLLNIAHGTTAGHQGQGSLRAELRHLRSIGLIRRLSGKHIGDLTTGSVHDLADFVELTSVGKQWVERLER